MSNAFLDSEWEHVKEIDLENCFVILSDDVTTADRKCLKPEIRAFIKSARRILKWGEKDFWKKIR